jgi:competence ComEA-like helix-hairpin-helix protein
VASNAPLKKLKFNRREKRGSLILLLLVLALLVLPKFFRYQADPLHVSLTEEEIEFKAAFEKKKQEKKAKTKFHYKENKKDYQRPLPKAPFDPDTMSMAAWQNLGLSERQSEVLISYRNRIGGFYNINQLYDAYVLDSSRVNEWQPFLVFNKKKPVEQKLEINSATREDFMALKGIGEKLSERIITFRDKLGGFASVDQISEVYGLSPETFQAIKPKLKVDLSKIKKLNVNALDMKTLAQHPYISYNLAKLIVNYREQHGPYQKLEDLLNSKGIEPDDVKKIEAYVTFAP